MALPLTTIPATFIAGDTFDVVLTLSDFQQPAWSSVIYLTGFGLNRIPITGAAYGTDHRFLNSGGTTGSWVPGQYTWTLRVASGDTFETVDSGLITILPNPATATAATDGRSHARRALDLIEAALEQRLPNGLESYSVAGRDVRKLSFKDLMSLRDRYRAEVASEEAKLLGKSAMRNHLFQFSRQ